MKAQFADTRPESAAANRNPFGVMDVPAPEDDDVKAFAAATVLDGGDDDVNAALWSPEHAHSDGIAHHGIDGEWMSRWNGGADPTIAGDTNDAWKSGPGEAQTVGAFVYLLFSWDEGRRRGLIEARRDGARLVGKYINLSNPAITRPWVGLIVSARRIDGRWPGGRLDFRR